jgi:hypothetical protein
MEESGLGVKVLSQHFPDVTEENHEHLHVDSQSPSRYLNVGPPKL